MDLRVLVGLRRSGRAKGIDIALVECLNSAVVPVCSRLLFLIVQRLGHSQFCALAEEVCMFCHQKRILNKKPDL